MLVSGVTGKAAGQQEEVGGAGRTRWGAGRPALGPGVSPRVRQGKPLPHTR